MFVSWEAPIAHLVFFNPTFFVIRLIVNATVKGKVLLNYLDSSNVTVASDQGPNDWASLQLPKTALHSHLYLASRKSVRIFDLRAKPAFRTAPPLYQFQGREMLGGLCEPLNDHQLFGCTNRQVFWVDIRMPGEVVELCHATDSSLAINREPVPLGCSMIKIPDSR